PQPLTSTTATPSLHDALPISFNDVYGFLTGNEIIRLVGRICQRVVQEYGNTDDFVGHIGGDDFLVVTTPDRANLLCKQISAAYRSEEHTSELQSRGHLVCRLL